MQDSSETLTRPSDAPPRTPVAPVTLPGRPDRNIGTFHGTGAPALLTEPLGTNRGSGCLPDWERTTRATVVACDLLIAVVGVVIALTAISGTAPGRTDVGLTVATLVALIGSLLTHGAWSTSGIGAGGREYRRVALAVLITWIVVVFLGLVSDPVAVTPWAVAVIPAVGACLFVGRFVHRRSLHNARRSGKLMLPVVVAGGVPAVRELIRRTRDDARLGWRVESAHLVAPSPDDAATMDEIDGVPVLGDAHDLGQQVRRGGYRVVVVAPDPTWTPERTRRLLWELEGTRAELVLAPAMLDVPAARVRAATAMRMPLLQVSKARFTGAQRVVKELVDRIGSGLLTALFAPLLLGIAVAIKLDDRGPVFYRQQRVKRDGEFFHIWKFRTMRVGADQLMDDLAEINEGTGPQFKIRKDPRVTRVGVFLRRFSLDELPQLFNVVAGSMSLVGPRPHVLHETQTYGPTSARRIMVKPGMTGLWQVSGRSELSWDEMIDLDLQYVDDWSLGLDIAILWQTVHAVLTGRGAY